MYGTIFFERPVKNMLNISLPTILTRVITLLFAFTFHELAHAWVATRFGDDTPRYDGRLTLNPLAHLDPIGTLMLLVAGFGWAKPVRVNAYTLRQRSPSAMMWVSLSGPVSNLLLAIIAAIPLNFQLITYTIPSSRIFPTPYQFLLNFIVINLSLALFNLIPLGPLDGMEIFMYFIPRQWQRYMVPLQEHGALILMLLIFVGPLIGLDLLRWILGPAVNGLLKILLGAII
jgi:Zn-dependent protease